MILQFAPVSKCKKENLGEKGSQTLNEKEVGKRGAKGEGKNGYKEIATEYNTL